MNATPTAPALTVPLIAPNAVQVATPAPEARQTRPARPGARRRRPQVIDLPNEIIVRVFTHLAPRDVHAAACSHSAFLAATFETRLWQRQADVLRSPPAHRVLPAARLRCADRRMTPLPLALPPFWKERGVRLGGLMGSLLIGVPVAFGVTLGMFPPCRSSMADPPWCAALVYGLTGAGGAVAAAGTYSVYCLRAWHTARTAQRAAQSARLDQDLGDALAAADGAAGALQDTAIERLRRGRILQQLVMKLAAGSQHGILLAAVQRGDLALALRLAAEPDFSARLPGLIDLSQQAALLRRALRRGHWAAARGLLGAGATLSGGGDGIPPIVVANARAEAAARAAHWGDLEALLGLGITLEGTRLDALLAALARPAAQARAVQQAGPRARAALTAAGAAAFASGDLARLIKLAPLGALWTPATAGRTALVEAILADEAALALQFHAFGARLADLEEGDAASHDARAHLGGLIAAALARGEGLHAAQLTQLANPD